MLLQSSFSCQFEASFEVCIRGSTTTTIAPSYTIKSSSEQQGHYYYETKYYNAACLIPDFWLSGVPPHSHTKSLFNLHPFVVFCCLRPIQEKKKDSLFFSSLKNYFSLHKWVETRETHLYRNRKGDSHTNYTRKRGKKIVEIKAEPSSMVDSGPSISINLLHSETHANSGACLGDASNHDGIQRK